MLRGPFWASSSLIAPHRAKGTQGQVQVAQSPNSTILGHIWVSKILGSKWT